MSAICFSIECLFLSNIITRQLVCLSVRLCVVSRSLDSSLSVSLRPAVIFSFQISPSLSLIPQYTDKVQPHLSLSLCVFLCFSLSLTLACSRARARVDLATSLTFPLSFFLCHADTQPRPTASAMFSASCWTEEEIQTLPTLTAIVLSTSVNALPALACCSTRAQT